MWLNKMIAVVFLGVMAQATTPVSKLKLDRWELTNHDYYEDASQTAPTGTKLYRLKREAASAEGGARCANEWREKIAKKKSDLSGFCIAFFTEVTPTFHVLLNSTDTGPVELQGIDVDVKHVSVLKGGAGFFTDEANYDLFIKAVVGQTYIQMRRPLKFTKLGGADLRLGFDTSSLGPAPQPVAIEFILRFHVEGSSGTATVETDPIRIEL